MISRAGLDQGRIGVEAIIGEQDTIAGLKPAAFSTANGSEVT